MGCRLKFSICTATFISSVLRNLPRASVVRTKVGSFQICLAIANLILAFFWETIKDGILIIFSKSKEEINISVGRFGEFYALIYHFNSSTAAVSGLVVKAWAGSFIKS